MSAAAKTERDVTKADAEKLSAAQLTAIDLICLGKNFADVAREIDVTRQTISRWFNHDSDFRLAVEARRTEAHQASLHRLRGLVPRALDVLEKALAGDGALKAAVQVIKMAGLNNAPAPLNPEDLGDLEDGRKWRFTFDAARSAFGDQRGANGKKR